MSIRHWPAGDRPREKLLERGAGALSDAELLAIFLRTGIPGKSAVDLARELLTRFGGLRGQRWRERLHALVGEKLRGPDGKLALTFEIVYGHALKPLPRPRVGEHSAVSLSDMRSMLGSDKRGRG